MFAMLEARPIQPDQTHDLRSRVLRPGAPMSQVVFARDESPLTLHSGVFEGDRLLAIGSVYLESRDEDAPGTDLLREPHLRGTAWRLRGMATDPDARRRGAGALALAACVGYARNRGGELIWCNARTPAIPFYEAQGWTVLGEEFEIPQAGPHFVMELQL